MRVGDLFSRLLLGGRERVALLSDLVCMLLFENQFASQMALDAVMNDAWNESHCWPPDERNKTYEYE